MKFGQINRNFTEKKRHVIAKKNEKKFLYLYIDCMQVITDRLEVLAHLSHK